MSPLIIVLIIVGVIVLGLIGIYNSLITRRNQVDNSFASIDVMLKKRADLIPSLVSTVKGYAKHEEELFTKVTELRNQIKQVGLDAEGRVQLENELTKGMSRIMIISEAYPDLKASDNFIHLQKSIADMEDQLSAARRAFNASVNDYNNGIEKFPSNIIAGMMNFKRKSMFELPSTNRADFENTPEINI